MNSPTDGLRTNKITIGGVCLYLFTLLGVATIISGALPRSRYELDYGGYIAMVRTSWWGFVEQRSPIRLQRLDDWKEGHPYRPPPSIEEYDWFMQDKNREWFPMDLSGDWR